MCLSGVVLGVWSAVSGISGQAAAGPYVTFMLGYAPARASAAAFMFAIWSSLAAVAAWVAFGGERPDVSVCLLTALGATVGALLAARFTVPGARTGVRTGRALLVLGLAFVAVEGARARFGGPPQVPLDWLRSPIGWAVTGLACGLVARVFALPSGVALVPGLVYATALPPAQALATALSVAVLAGALPVIGYVFRAERDAVMGPSLTIGGVGGGIAGGYLMARLAGPQDAWPLVTFAVTGMLLCSWLAYRSSD